MDAHVGGETGVVDLDAADFVGGDEAFPFGEDFEGFGEDRQEAFDRTNLPGDLRHRETEAILVHRPRGHIPVLGNDLWSGVEVPPRLPEMFNGAIHHGMFNQPRVGILTHGESIVVGVNGFAGESGIRQVRNLIGILG
jgi:hypothetical protein